MSSKLRVKILDLLMKKPMPVNEITKILKEEQSKVSHNLKRLHDCHFIEVERKGKERIYSLNKKTMVPLMKLVEKHVQCYCKKECYKK